MLALEDPETMSIRLNDVAIPSSSSRTGPAKGNSAWWVDEAIRTLPIPGHTIVCGTNTLTITFPFGILTNIERIYILGSFSVQLTGSSKLLKHLDINTLSWGNITTQGLPFYVGNVIYNYSFSLPNSQAAQEVSLSVPRFSSPVLVVHSNPTLTERNAGSKPKKLGRIAFQPHTLALGKFEAGTHRISITAFGNRYNAFGHIHLADGITNQCWPDIWRSMLLRAPFYNHFISLLCCPTSGFPIAALHQLSSLSTLVSLNQFGTFANRHKQQPKEIGGQTTTTSDPLASWHLRSFHPRYDQPPLLLVLRLRANRSRLNG